MGLEELSWPERREILKRLKSKNINEAKQAIELVKKGFSISNRVQKIVSKVNIEKPFTIVSYFTVDTGYEKEILNLIDSLNKLGLSYYIEGIRDTGNWTLNTHYKPIIIRKILDLIDKPVIFIDADARVQKYPLLFDDTKEDFMGYFPDRDKTNNTLIKDKVLSGTIFFNNTVMARELLDLWVKKCQVQRGDWDQQILSDAIKALGDKLSIKNLPPTYVQIHDLMKKFGDPIIEHYQASRRHKKLTDESNTSRFAIMVPTKGRPQNIKRLVESAYNTASYPDRIRFYFMIPGDDEKTKKMIPQLHGDFVLMEEPKKKKEEIVNLSKLWNLLHKEAKTWGDYFGFYGDDVEFRTYGWDSIVASEFKRARNKPWMIRTNDSYQKDIAVLFFTNKTFHKVLGYYLPEQYKWVAMDEWLSTIAQESECYSYLEHIDTYHHAVILGRGPEDETFKEKRKDNCIHIRKDLQLYKTKKEKEKRQKDIERLKYYVQSLG